MNAGMITMVSMKNLFQIVSVFASVPCINVLFISRLQSFVARYTCNKLYTFLFKPAWFYVFVLRVCVYWRIVLFVLLASRHLISRNVSFGFFLFYGPPSSVTYFFLFCIKSVSFGSMHTKHCILSKAFHKIICKINLCQRIFVLFES